MGRGLDAMANLEFSLRLFTNFFKNSARHLKATKRLSRIKEVVVDVLNNKAQVIFYPTFVNVSNLILYF